MNTDRFLILTPSTLQVKGSIPAMVRFTYTLSSKERQNQYEACLRNKHLSGRVSLAIWFVRIL